MAADTFTPSSHLVHWLVQTVAMLFTGLILPGLKVSGPISAFLAVIVLAFINAHVWDAALFFQVPDTLSSQMLVLLLANAVIFWLVIKILPGVEIEGLLAPILAPVLFTLLSVLFMQVEKQIDWSGVVQTSKEVVNDVKGYVKEEKK